MSSPSHPAAGPPSPKPRLDGWKEIAVHVGRGIRTAQRWERDLGMPVHRLSTGPGEAVYALREEIDAWIARQSRASLSPSASDHDDNGAATGSGASRQTAPGSPRAGWRHRAVPWAVAVVAVVALAASLTWRERHPPSAGNGDPVAITGAGRTLTALGPDGEVLWRQKTDVPVDWLQDAAERAKAVAFGDLDLDGRNEVIVAGNQVGDDTVRIWTHDGRPIVARGFTRHVRFGEYSCPPARATHALVEVNPRFPGTVWVWGQHPNYFPAVLQRLAARGEARSEYWSNGYIGIVRSFVLAGRPVTFVGAANNEQHGASLAAFYGDVNGSAPSANPKYRCEGCPAGQPDAFLVFPRSPLQEALGVEAWVSNVVLAGPDRIGVTASFGPPGEGQRPTAFSYYTLDASLRVLHAEIGGSADAVHRKYEAEKLTTAATRYRDEHLFPVKRWNGTGWDLIPAAAPPKEANEGANEGAGRN